MGESVRELCMLSVLFGVLLNITPEGSVKKVSTVLCSAVFVTVLLTGFGQTDFSAFLTETARYREESCALADNAEDSRRRLSRLVIQSECEAYISDKAEKLGIQGASVKVSARWSTEGFWLPEKAVIRAECTPQQRAALSEAMETELGIGREQQIWTE